MEEDMSEKTKGITATENNFLRWITGGLLTILGAFLVYFYLGLKGTSDAVSVKMDGYEKINGQLITELNLLNSNVYQVCEATPHVHCQTVDNISLSLK
jgi:hypothetical protein